MSTQPLIESLDARYPRWDMYRSADKRWIVRLDGGETIQGDTIEEALQAAADFVPLPRIPRKPQLLSLDSFTAVKSGSYWRLQYDGQDYCVQTATKKAAMEAAQKICERARLAYFVWVEMHGLLVEQGTEGVDYRWQ